MLKAVNASSMGASMNWPLPLFALAKRSGDDSVGGVEAGDLVGHQRGHVARRAAVTDVEEISDARARLDQVVIGGLALMLAARAVAGAVDVDEVFADRLEVVIAKAQTLQPVHPHIGEEHIGLLDEAAERLDAIGRLEVEEDGALVPVAAHVDRAHAGGRRGARMAHDVACPVLDLDHVCAHVAEQLGCVGAEDDGREVEDS